MLSIIRFVKKTAEIRAKIEVKVRVRHKVGVFLKKEQNLGFSKIYIAVNFV